jgi:proline dehydrogenase
MYSGSKALFYALSRSASLKRLASQYGMASSGSFARRFIAGETIDEAIEAARALQAQSLLITLDYLGESVRSIDEASAATREYVRLIDVIVASGIERNISLKLTQLGVDVDRATCVDNLRRILEPARTHGFFVRIDMENSPYTDVTIEVFETMWQQEYRNLGVALQAGLYRTESDIRRMNELGARVRLVKGAYKEPASVAHQQKADVDAAFVKLMQILLDDGTYPAIATHDDNMVTIAREHAERRGIVRNAFEFQLLYGIRRDLQSSLLAAGYPVRVYVPFGREWFPYFMRRLGERPENVGFVIRSVLRERT